MTLMYLDYIMFVHKKYLLKWTGENKQVQFPYQENSDNNIFVAVTRPGVSVCTHTPIVLHFTVRLAHGVPDNRELLLYLVHLLRTALFLSH